MPLAKRLELDGGSRRAIWPRGSPFFPAIELIENLPDDSVLCSHGDLIPEVMDALIRRGLEVVGEHDGRKGARWEIQRSGQQWRAHAEPPPDREPL